MDNATAYSPVEEPWVWSAAGLAARDDWVIRLDEGARQDIAAALDGVKRRGLALEDITADDFPLPSVSAGLAKVKALLSDGPGLCLVRGFPVDDYGRDDLAIVLWGFGAHLGTGVSQSYRGDLIGDVMDMSHTGDIRRSYRSPRPLDLHADPVDVVGLLCLRRAKDGGASLLTSSLAVHNAVLAERPELMDSLYRGYHYRHSEASSTGERPTSAHRVPVFGRTGGRVVCCFNAAPIARSLAEDDIDYGPADLEALKVFKGTAMRDDLMHRMMLEPGDLQFLNNRAVLHGRTRFEDFEALGRKRLMLRLWLKMGDWPGLPDAMAPRRGWGDAGTRGAAV